ncbi:DUF4233 domain-containing protein [Pseudonocardia lacus]|uniref:DUF4233 domain-containing protein n=1 Tax=Pseudonocardia lacus TaxID=2835865 RepID=UPI001BDC851C|nr:DUF4233 domain-containing protein [Pseudonocardia lacus]
MSEPAPVDPLKGLRGVYAAVLVLEAITVALSMLVLPKDDPGTNSIAITLITALAVLMVVAAGLQRRPWGLGLALGLQVATIAVGLALVPALAVMGVVFALVWAGILWMRRDVQARMARGELPAQQRAAADPTDS